MMIVSTVFSHITLMLISVCLIVTAMSCSLGDLVNNQALPTNIEDPKVVRTPEGAMGSYYSAVAAFRASIGSISDGEVIPDHRTVIGSSGLLTDELQSHAARNNGTFPLLSEDLIDARVDGIPLDGPYALLHGIRGRAHEAITALRTYHPTAPSALIGNLLAIEGMAEVLLAELYCSGIPLSTLDFDGGYTLQPGSSTKAVFHHALTLFDSAFVAAGDSVAIRYFASLGRARALLGLQDVAAAALAVENVPTSYRYLVPIDVGSHSLFKTDGLWDVSVSDREGGFGLPFVSSGDPRSTSDSLLDAGGNLAGFIPRKYRDPGALNSASNPGKVAIVFASGIEARLIEAEATVLAGDASWLVKLNALRTSCVPSTICPIPAPAGTGGVGNLPLLPDPALDPIPVGSTARDVRLDVIFKERAYWLFLTGRRQADLRRLVEQYGRKQQVVYPSGLWGTQHLGFYGARISLPVPNDEQTNNPLYRGCEN